MKAVALNSSSRLTILRNYSGLARERLDNLQKLLNNQHLWYPAHALPRMIDYHSIYIYIYIDHR